jgi:hypothetical protein
MEADMVRLSDSYSAASMVILVDGGVLADMAEALSGAWNPGDEGDDGRRERLLAAARLRLYGTPDLTGCQVVTTATAHSGLSDVHGVPWGSGLVPVLETFEDAPPAEDVAGLERLLHEDGLDADTASALALALLTESVDLVVTREPSSLHHQRVNDLPERLALVDPQGAVARLDLSRSGLPDPELPGDSPLSDSERWWRPEGGGSGA